ncbi:MAG: SPOR domain-containing protein [Flavobacteriaceae bacterium]
MGAIGYIEELLYRYNCVVVPEFGAFLTQNKPAYIHRTTNTISPPAKLISFNEQLSSNDGLLVSYMASAEEKSYEEVLKNVLEESKHWKQQLHKGDRLVLDNVGELWLNREGKIQFQPAKKVNYLTSSFGLSSVITSSITREVLKEEVVELEEKIPFIITPEERSKGSYREVLKYAAVVLLAISTGLTGFKVYNETLSGQQMVHQQAQEIVSKNIQEATFFNSKPFELPVLSINVNKKETGRHHIIAGAFRFRENADKKVRQLRKKGFQADYLGQNKFGLHQVTYGSYQDPKEALKFLKQIRRTESADAWLLSRK